MSPNEKELIEKLRAAYCELGMVSLFKRDINDTLLQFYKTRPPTDKKAVKRQKGLAEEFNKKSLSTSGQLIIEMISNLDNIISQRKEYSKKSFKTQYVGRSYNSAHRTLREIQELLLVILKTSSTVDALNFADAGSMVITLKEFIYKIIEDEIFIHENGYIHSVSKALFDLINPLEETEREIKNSIRRCSSEKLLEQISVNIDKATELFVNFCFLIANFENKNSNNVTIDRLINRDRDMEQTRLGEIIRVAIMEPNLLYDRETQVSSGTSSNLYQIP